MHGPRTTDHDFARPSPLQLERPAFVLGSSASFLSSSPSPGCGSTDSTPQGSDHAFFRRTPQGDDRLQDKSKFLQEITDLKGTSKSLQARRRVVQKMPYFSELEAIQPGFCDDVAAKAEFVPARSGTVLFRQGDPASCSYFIVFGKVALFEQDMAHRYTRPRTPEYDGKKVSKGCLGALCGSMRSKETHPLDLESEEKDRQSQRLYSRQQTLEGFSTYSLASHLGKRTKVLEGGDTLGDAALSTQEKRDASAQCLEDCEFVRVHKGSFDVEVAEKLCFFKRHVPGFRDIQISHHQEHPAFAFEDCLFKEGATLLEEGSVAKPSIFIIRRGAVSFRRQVRAKVGIRGGKNHRCWQVMKDRDMFSSLGMLGVGSIEACSAVVTSKECFCYILSGSTMDDFRVLSNDLMGAVLEHVRQTMKPLLQLSSAFCGVDALPPAPDDRSWGGIISSAFVRRMSRRSSNTSRQKVEQSRRSNGSVSPASEDANRLSVRSVY